MTRNEMHFNSIRKENIVYLFAFPLMMIFINIDFTYTPNSITAFGIDVSALLPFVFCIGSFLMLLVKEKHFPRASHVSAVIMLVGFCIRVLPLDGLGLDWLNILAYVICWIAVGSCGVGALLYFCIKLNNAERMLGILFEVTFIGMYMMLVEPVRETQLERTIILFVILALFAYSALRFRSTDTSRDVDAPPVEASGNYWALIYAISYFIIFQLFNVYIASSPMFSGTAYGIGGLATVVIAVVIHFVAQRSSWQMWNVLILAAVIAVVLFWFPYQTAITWGSFFAGMCTYAGDVVIFYTCAGLIKRFYSFRFFKRFFLAFYGVVGISYGSSNLILAGGPSTVLLATTIFVGLVFVVLLFLSTTLYTKLFAATWADDYHKIDMSENLEEPDSPEQISEEERMQAYGLTQREQELCVLLLQGLTLQQVASTLGISFHTVSAHNRNIYRKLGIQSRAELMLLFLNKDVPANTLE